MSANMPNVAQPVSATAPFSVTLEAQQWNMVIACMAKATYELAAPLIQLIGQQLQEQTPAATGANGHDAVMPLTN